MVRAKRWQESTAETVQVVLPNDSNPLGYILGGTVMHLIDITGAIACHRHTNTLALTAGVDGLEFIHPIKVGDLILLKSRVTCVFGTSLEVEVEVFSEEIETGTRKLTSRAYLTFVSIDRDGKAQKVEIKQSSGFERLDQAAIQIALQTRYRPGKKDGQSEAMWYALPVPFELK